MEIVIHPEAAAVIESLRKGKKADPKKLKKVLKTLDLLASDPHYPSLATHRYEALDGVWSEQVWQSYVEQGTPSAWRMWWYFGPTSGTITVIDIGPHP